MKAIGAVIKAPLKAIGLIPKTPKPPEMPKPVSRDDAEESARSLEEINRRKGATADQVTGSGGAEAGAGGKTSLG